ncbi:DUF3060 domain-containing protein [Bacterioplanoides pacificum]|uniref:DUF3060 domain-containing protein n=1 Tax=Bacterioplanoides pacificum TaxID=1171596 RepID=A0ABV7VUS8_9GAMM
MLKTTSVILFSALLTACGGGNGDVMESGGIGTASSKIVRDSDNNTTKQYTAESDTVYRFTGNRNYIRMYNSPKRIELYGDHNTLIAYGNKGDVVIRGDSNKVYAQTHIKITDNGTNNDITRY